MRFVSCFALSAAWALVSLPVSLLAAPIVAGSHVLPRTADARLFDGQHMLARADAGVLLDVVRLKGEWLWVGRGWIRRADVVEVGQAVELFTAELARKPSAVAYINRGRAYYQQRQFDLAVADYNRALALDPHNAAGLSCRGRAYLDMRLPHLAMTDFNRAIELARFPSAYCFRGHAHLNAGDELAAGADFDEAVRLDPRSSAAWASRALLLSRQDKNEAALSDLAKALDLNPRLVPALNNRANIYFKQGLFAEAVEDYTAALSAEPKASVYFNRAIALAKMGQVQRAIADYSEAIRLEPNFGPAYYHRANLRLEAGFRREAEDDLKRAAALDPMNKST